MFYLSLMEIKELQEESLRNLIRSMGSQGALAILAFGYRAVQIWREEFPIQLPTKEEYARMAEERKNAKEE